MAKLYFKYGAMKSGKTTEIIKTYYNYLFFDVPKMVYVDIERPIAIRPFNKYLFKINNGWEKEYPVKYQPYGDDDNFYLPTKINSSILNNDFNKTLLKDIFSTQ